MAFTDINVGASANDGTGDSLRAASQKINANFDDAQTQLDGKAALVHAHGADEVQYDGTAAGIPSASVQATIDYLATQLDPGSGPEGEGTFLASGGGVAWVSGLTFRVSAARYYLNGVLKTSIEQTVTLAAAHTTLGRFDAIVLDTNGVATSLAGTPSPTPEFPDVDPQTYLELSLVSVPASGTTPGDVSSVVVYAENNGAPTEWATGTVGSGWAVASTNNPKTGAKCVEATAVTDSSRVTFTAVAPVALEGKTGLVLNLRSKADWGANLLRLYFYNGAVRVGDYVTVGNGRNGFDSTNTTTYQQVVVPLSLFNFPAGSSVDKLSVQVRAPSGSIGFYLDEVSIQDGSGTSGPGGGFGQTEADLRYLRRDLNGSDVPDAAAFRTNVGAAPIDSPAFQNVPTTPTAPLGTNTAQVASTAFVQAAVAGFTWLNDQTPSGAVNGSNTVFTLPTAFASGQIRLFVAGLRQKAGTHYTPNPTAGSFTLSAAPLTGDDICVDYVPTGPLLYSPSFNFSVARNSQYLLSAILEDWGF